jgi:hypothetical protein
MKVRTEITVALENAPGRLAHLTKCLADRKVNILAISVLESTDMGLVRMVVDKPAVALKMLAERCAMTCTASEVLEVTASNKAGALAAIAARLARKRVNIDYLYGSATSGGKASIIVKVANMKSARKDLR